MASRLCPAHRVPFIYDMASSIPAELRRRKLFGGPSVQACSKAPSVPCSGGQATSSAAWASATTSDAKQRAPRSASGDSRLRNPQATLAQSPTCALPRHRPRRLGPRIHGKFCDLPRRRYAVRGVRHGPPQRRAPIAPVRRSYRHRRSDLTARLDAAAARRVRLVPRRPSHEVPLYVALADCLVSPRRATDNVPLKIFDYMGSGKPIIATSGRAHEPPLTPESAILCNGTTDELAAAILYAAANPSRMQDLCGPRAITHGFISAGGHSSISSTPPTRR